MVIWLIIDIVKLFDEIIAQFGKNRALASVEYRSWSRFQKIQRATVKRRDRPLRREDRQVLLVDRDEAASLGDRQVGSQGRARITASSIVTANRSATRFEIRNLKFETRSATQ